MDTLAASIDSDDVAVTLTVGSHAGAPHRWEIESEALTVLDYTRGTKTATVLRGADGTTAASHTSGTRVLIDPRFLTTDYNDAINSAIERMSSLGLFRPLTADLTYSFATVGYNLPANCREVYRVQARAPGSEKAWQDIRNFDVIQDGLSTDFSTTKAIQLRQGYSGQTVRVTYWADYGIFTDDSTDSANSALGIQAYVEDAIIFGAAAELFALEEADRTLIDAGEEAARSQQVPPRHLISTAAAFDLKFNQRVSEARKTLGRMYPPRVQR